jgi:putative ABC transport system permease protein
MSRVAPLVFLAVTAILMHLVVSRLIGTQQEQIATLAAFGYTPLEIGSHYVKLAIVVLLWGAAMGVPLGWWLGVNLAQMYTRFFRFPQLTFQLDAQAVGWSVAIASAAAIGGVAQAVGRAVRIRPAAAMQPEPPAVYRVSLVERLGVGPLLAPTTRMMLRHLERRPMASGLSILGLALGAAVMVLGMFVGDAIESLAEFQFTQVQRFDRSVAFVEPVGRDAVAELARLPGVQAVEPFRVAAATLRFGQRERRQELMATAADTHLFRILDIHGQVHQPRGDGLIMSRRLAELLGAKLGDAIDVDLLEGRRPRTQLVIAGLVDDMVGTSAWLPGDSLQQLLNEGPRFSGAFLVIEDDAATTIDTRLADSPRGAGFVSRQRQLDTFRETIAQTLLRMRSVNTLFAIAIACGVVATTARQSVIERSRDLASLRVLGYTRREVAAILVGEQALLTLAAVPLGLVLGLGFVHITTWGYDTDLFRVPAIVLPRTYAISAATVFAAALVTAGIVRRLLDRLDLVAVLKVRD